MSQSHLSIILVSHTNLYLPHVRPDMGKVEIHWPATVKVPRVNKRKHFPPVLTAILFSGYSNMPNQCQVGKGIDV